MIIEAGKSQEVQRCSSNPKADRFETWKTTKLQFKFKGRGKNNIPFQGQAEWILTQRGGQPFCSDFQLIRWSSPTLGRTICFTQPINLNVKVVKKYPHRNTQNGVSEHTMALSSWHIKLTITDFLAKTWIFGAIFVSKEGISNSNFYFKVIWAK